jgi:hypothetical protein
MICFPARCALLPLALFTLAVGSMAQSTATVSLDRAAFKAGEVIKANLTLDIPSPCDGAFIVPFKKDSGQGEIDLFANSTKGSQTISVSAQPPFDDPGGNFVADSALIRCAGFQNPRHVSLSDKIQFTIIPVPDTNPYPTHAAVALNVTQKQFLETKTDDLDRLLVKFANGVEQYPNTTEAQKQFLVTIIESAQLLLHDSEGEYKRQILKQNQTLPVFFEDFRANYRDLETEIKARKIVEIVGAPHLQLAQLKKRPKPQSPATSSTTLSPDATAVSHLVEDNAKAYRYVEETGGANFTTALLSIPAGARVSYRRTTQQYFADYPTPTDVNSATFSMAYMQFRFHKENCGDDQFLRVDPWDNPKAPIKVEFTKCH